MLSERLLVLHRNIVWPKLSEYVTRQYCLKNYLCNVCSHLFAGELFAKFYLDLARPILHKKIACAMLAHSQEKGINWKFFYQIKKWIYSNINQLIPTILHGYYKIFLEKCFNERKNKTRLHLCITTGTTLHRIVT